jgi:hypothetical protein
MPRPSRRQNERKRLGLQFSTELNNTQTRRSDSIALLVILALLFRVGNEGMRGNVARCAAGS